MKFLNNLDVNNNNIIFSDSAIGSNRVLVPASASDEVIFSIRKSDDITDEFVACKFTVKVASGSDSCVRELLCMHDGVNGYITDYGIVSTADFLAEDDYEFIRDLVGSTYEYRLKIRPSNQIFDRDIYIAGTFLLDSASKYFSRPTKFTPLSIAGLQLWLDAADNLTQTFSLKGAYLDDGSLYEAGLHLPGTNTADYANVTNSPELNITGDIDLRAEIKYFSGMSTGLIISKYRAVGDSGYAIDLNGSTGIVRLIYDDGISTFSISSTVSVPYSAGQKFWIRATLDVDNEASGNTVNFYTSTNGTSWVALGSSVISAGTTSIASNTRSLAIGTRTAAPSSPFFGIIYRVQIYDGIDGTIEFDADFTKQMFESTSFTEDSANSATVTIVSTTSGAFEGAVSQWDDKSGNDNHVVQATAANQPITGVSTINGLNVIDFDGVNDNLSVTFASAIAQASTQFIVFERDSGSIVYDGTTINDRNLVFYDGGQNQFRLFAGTTQSIGNPTGYPTILSIIFDDTSSKAFWDGSEVSIAGGLGSDALGGLTIAARYNNQGNLGGAVAEMLIYDSALSDTNREAVQEYLAGKWGITLA